MVPWGALSVDLHRYTERKLRLLSVMKDLLNLGENLKLYTFVIILEIISLHGKIVQLNLIVLNIHIVD